MNSELEALKKAAIEHAKRQYHSVAIMYTVDGDVWSIGSHNEARYIRSYVPFDEATEILICQFERENAKWTTYFSRFHPVDYVAETGATGKMAEVLETIALMELLAKCDEDTTGTTPEP